MSIKRLAILACIMLSGEIGRTQLKDMPSQAEFDPILENADKKLKDFVATLTEFRVEAVAIDRERLDVDLKSVRQLQQMIQVTHSGNGKNSGMSMQRLVAILSTLDDMAMDAATWKSLAELHMCQQLLQHENPTQRPTRYDQFGIRVNMNFQMLREVGGQLIHPTLRMASTLDEILAALADETPKIRPKP